MKRALQTRKSAPAIAGGFALVGLLFANAVAQPPGRQPAPIERRGVAAGPPASPQARANQPAAQPYNGGMAPRPNQGNGSQQGGSQQTVMVPGHPVKNQQHLADWMESHRNLPIAQQQSALESEPGFHTLKPQEQIRMHQRLQQLNSLPQEQQTRVLARTEAMERLPPATRQQIRGAAAQLGGLPPDRRKAVAGAFHSALDMPENQRQAWVNSPQNRAQFNDQERSTLNNLLQVAPAAGQAGLPGFVPRSQQQRFNQPQ